MTFALSGWVYGQSAAEVSGSDGASSAPDAGQPVRVSDLILQTGYASGSFDPLVPPDDPKLAMTGMGYRLREFVNDDTATWGAFSKIAVQFFDVPPSLMFSIFRSPNYALKELQYLGMVDDDLHPGRPITLEQANAVLSLLKSALETGDLR